MKKQITFFRQRAIKLGGCKIQTPTLWLGHDLNHPIKVWRELAKCPGVMLNAFQIFMKPAFHARALENGLHDLLCHSGPIFLDSGGFLFQQDGKCKVTPAKVLSLYKQLKPDLAAVLDVPLHPLATPQSNYRRWQSTLKNTIFMHKHNSCIELAPVFHAYSLSVVKRRHEQLQRITPNPRIVCIGSLVPLLKASYIGSRFIREGNSLSPTLQRWRFIVRLILAIRELYPTAILHVFGVGSLSTMYLFFLLGIDSVDSVSWRLKAAYGEIQLPGLSNRSFSPRGSTNRPRRPLEGKDLDLLAQCLCPICRDHSLSKRVHRLSTSFTARAIHNAYVFISELEAIRVAMKAGQLLQFLEGRLQTSPVYLKVLSSVVMPEIKKSGYIISDL